MSIASYGLVPLISGFSVTCVEGKQLTGEGEVSIAEITSDPTEDVGKKITVRGIVRVKSEQAYIEAEIIR